MRSYEGISSLPIFNISGTIKAPKWSQRVSPAALDYSINLFMLHLWPIPCGSSHVCVLPWIITSHLALYAAMPAGFNLSEVYRFVWVLAQKTRGWRFELGQFFASRLVFHFSSFQSIWIDRLIIPSTLYNLNSNGWESGVKWVLLRVAVHSITYFSERANPRNWTW